MLGTANSSGTEAHPVLLSVPTKKSKPVQFGPCILPYITTAYAEESSKYQVDCQLLDTLRQDALDLPEVIDTFAIERLFMYLSQLSHLTSRFPLDIGLEYPWYPVFKANSKLVKRANLNYERANIVFTIAAAYSQLGSTETRISTEGIRKACIYYQYAAGCFKYVAREILPEMRCEPTEDLDTRTLEALIALMLAQAQECMWQKAVMEHMKHGTIARLATKVADYFDALSVPEDTAVWLSSVLPGDWIKHAQIKAAYFMAVAQYHKANECISMSKYGEEIARLRIANAQATKALEAIQQSMSASDAGGYTLTTGFGLMSLLSAAPSALTGMVQPQSGFIEQVKTLLASIDRDLVRAEKDNNVVYLESIPDELRLAPILRSDMVKPTIPADLLDHAYWKRKPDVNINRPLFENLVPFAVHQAASVYVDKKEFVVKHDIVAKCQDLIDTHNALLDKLKLPDRLDTIDPDKLPDKLLSYAEEVQHDGGEQALLDMLTKVEAMSHKNAELVEMGFSILEEENERDEILRQHYGHLWARPISKELTASLLSQGTQYYDTLQAAMRADRIVRTKVTNWGKAIHLLSQTTPDILAHLPSIGGNAVDGGAEPMSSGKQQKQQLEECQALIARLRNLMQEGKDDVKSLTQIIQDTEQLAKTDDISRQLLAKAAELTGGSPIIKIEPEQFDDVFQLELKKYETTQGNVLALSNRQIDLHIKIQQAYEQLFLLLQGNPMAAKREAAIGNLEQAFAKFKEIRTNLVEGIKFYSQYTDTMTQFRDDCNDFAMSRKMEATELSRQNNSLVRRG